MNRMKELVSVIVILSLSMIVFGVTANLVVNSSFENGSTWGWSPFGSVTLIATTTNPHSGEYCLYTTGRTQSWMGPSYNLFGLLSYDQTYKVDFWVRYDEGPSLMQLKATVKTSSTNGADNYIQATNPTSVQKDVWTEISGEFSVPNGNYSGIVVYVESSNSTPSFYLDDFAIAGEISDTAQNLINTQKQEFEAATTPVSEYLKTIPALYESLSNYFPIGVAVEPGQLMSSNPHSQIVAKEFDMLVPENVMKPEFIEPKSGDFTFQNADAIVDYAIAHNMTMRGHNFIWYQETPNWFFEDPSNPSKPASKTLLLERMKDLITTTMKHFEDKYGSKNPIKYWDIVNEPLNDNGTLRDTKWLQIIGPDYIAKAFEYAHAADPNVKLFVNDYGMENDGVKAQAMYNLVKKLKSEGVPIDGIGIECHININTNLDKLKDVIKKFASLDVEVQFTEIDMSTLGNTSESALLQQAREYKKLFGILEAEHKYITAVVFWGISDDVSWLGSQNAPLLFNTSLQPKPDFWAIVDPTKAPMNIVNTQVLNTPEGTPSSTDWSKSLDFEIQPFTNVNTFVEGFGATAKIKTLWNKNDLYILANVSDTTPSSRDNIEFFIGNRSYRFFRGTISTKDLLETQNATSYTIQFTVPLSDSGINSQVGKTFGFDVRVNDYDNSTLKSVSVWNDYSNVEEDPIHYGQLMLSAKSQMTYSLYGTPNGISDPIWNTIQSVKIDKFIQGNSGATAMVKTMWNEKNLYVLANVWESNLNDSNSLPYRQDSVEVFVDQHNYKTPYYTDGDGQYRVNFENAQSFGPSTNSLGFESFATKTATGYAVEMIIPLNDITPAVGDVIGFDALVNVAGSGNNSSRKAIIIWSGNANTLYEETQSFGNLMLVRRLP